MVYNGELQHQKRLKDLNIGDLVVENGDEDVDPNMAFNLLTVASTGNAAFFYELLKEKFEPDIGDSQGKNPIGMYLQI